MNKPTNTIIILHALNVKTKFVGRISRSLGHALGPTPADRSKGFIRHAVSLPAEIIPPWIADHQ